MKDFLALRSKHQEFIYHSYEIWETGFGFHFSIDDWHFYPEWSFPEGTLKNAPDRKKLEYAVFLLGMAELPSYWKCCCPPKVIVKCSALDDSGVLWWKKLYFNGLGEFFYRNGINTDIASFMEIKPHNSNVPEFTEDYTGKGFLIPVGGGKDSVVTLELLKEYQKDSLCYIINPRGATLGCAGIAGYGEESIIGVHRTIHRQLLELNKEGYLNGHTPLSAVIAFSSWIFAYCCGKQYIALSNESSANESSVVGSGINHQYSKSTEFERDFRSYAEKNLGRFPEYFSLLRPWSEWQITKRFVEYPEYFPVFQSCNLGSKTNVWCADCAKCLYVYIMLSAFLEDSELVKIFGKNMLDDIKYREMFEGLIFPDKNKPFECVGTKAEVNLAISRSIERRKGKLPLLLEGYTGNTDIPDLDNYFDNDNFVPEFLLPALKG